MSFQFPVYYTEEESNALIALVDFAVKAQGLVVADRASHLVQKLRNAYAQANTPPASIPTAQAEPIKAPKKRGRPFRNKATAVEVAVPAPQEEVIQ